MKSKTEVLKAAIDKLVKELNLQGVDYRIAVNVFTRGNGAHDEGDELIRMEDSNNWDHSWY